ncbi:hypothetical protein POTOM_061520 [Populus tomentosa]|uniref:Uncharacterized protein n=1 Tax=Populus tomentosa TaxID=118781 RepID=A0A8X7XSZ9_POPTO|nr:hypothetical protein POTOM_061520 [Populus tomentosa]
MRTPAASCSRCREENKATTGDGEEISEGDDWDQLLVQRRDWSHHWIVAAASTCFQWLRGYKSVMAAGAEDNAAVEAGDGCVLRLLDRGGEFGGDGEKPKGKKERMRLWQCAAESGKMVGRTCWFGSRVRGFFGRLRGRRKQREKAGIGEKGVLVLWSGICEEERISGCLLLAGRGGWEAGPAASFSFLSFFF